MHEIFVVLILVGVLGCFYIYLGYFFLLRIICAITRRKERSHEAGGTSIPTATVLLTVYRENRQLKERLINILQSDGVDAKLEVVVVSDGPDSIAQAIVADFGDNRLVHVEAPVRSGKSSAQNHALHMITSEVVVFTDADTRFDRPCIMELISPFADCQVGAVTGKLVLRTSEMGVSEGHKAYWNIESDIRAMESRCGLLAVATGACLAVRRELIPELPGYVGEDCILPLEVVSQGKQVIYAEQAIAVDNMSSAMRAEFRTRVRMTLRNWQGTLKYKNLLNPISYPGYAWALCSHKILRWCSPVFILFWSVGAIAGIIENTWWGYLGGGPLVLICIGALVGYAVRNKSWKIRFVRGILGFVVANTAFATAFILLLRARKITVYK